MRGTGRFEVHSTSIETPGWNKTFSIVFFGDVHRFAPLHAEEEWFQFLDKYRNRPNTYFFGMGDYLDLLSASERDFMGRSGLHESTTQTLESFYFSKVREYCDELKFMKGKLLGMMEGNHHIRFSDGTTTAMTLCQQLKAKYLGDCAATKISLRFPSHNSTREIVIVSHHGVGGGRTSGAQFNSLDQMASGFEGADIYVMGDNHQRGAVPVQRLFVTKNHLGSPIVKAKEILLMRSGSFLKGYVPGKSSYVVDANMRPSCLGAIRVDITPTRIKFGSHGSEGEETSIKMEAVV